MMRRTLLAALTGLLVASCGAGRFGRAPRVYQDLTTASAACTKNPAGCAAMHGVAVEALDVATQAKVDQVVKECADLARRRC